MDGHSVLGREGLIVPWVDVTTKGWDFWTRGCVCVCQRWIWMCGVRCLGFYVLRVVVYGSVLWSVCRFGGVRRRGFVGRSDPPSPIP